MPTPIYSTVTVASVAYEQENGFSGQADLLGSLPRAAAELRSGFDPFDDPVFAVGIHAVDPAIGSGDAANLDSLIGLRILEPGTYTDVTVPIFPVTGFPELTDVRAGQTFPPNPNGETEVRAAIWETLSPRGLDGDDPPDDADDAPEDPFDLVDPFAVSAPATIADLDRNPALDPTDVSNPATLTLNVTNRLDEPVAKLRVEQPSNGETIATLTDAPLPLAPDADGVFEDLGVVQAGTDVTVVALDGDGNEIGAGEGEASAGLPEPVFVYPGS
jgi:hypothetical protein